ncbi:MAG: hypothetical protein AAF696_25375 [Bacteroidota bacterium]
MKKLSARNIIFLLLGLLPLYILYSVFTNLKIQPLLTDSISFDLKAQILSEMDNQAIDVMAVGSSISLNNIGSQAMNTYLGQDISYFNASSWGLKMRDVRIMLPGLFEKFTPKVLLLASGPMDFEEPQIHMCSELEFDWYIHEENHGFFYLNNTDLFSIIQREKRSQKLTLEANLSQREHLLFDQWGGINLLTTKENFHYKRFNKSLIKTTVDSQFEELEKIAEYVGEKGARLVFIASPMKKSPNCDSPACKAFIAEHNARIKDIVESKNQLFVDMHGPHQYPDSLFCDESHLVYEGPDMLAKELVSILSISDLLQEQDRVPLVHEK